MEDSNSFVLQIPIVKIKQVRQSKAKYNTSLSSPENIISMLDPIIKDADREVFIVIGLSTRNIPNVINVVSVGTLNSTASSPRDVFKALILSNCASFICVHNHVGGTLSPSESDKKITDTLGELGDKLEIKLLDHIIIGENKKFYSFRQNVPREF